MHSAEHPDGLVVADAEHRVIEWNPVAEKILQITRSNALGRRVEELLELDDHRGNFWFDHLRPYDGLATRTRLTEGQWYTADGRVVLVTASLCRQVRLGPVTKLVISLRESKSRAWHDRERSDMVATVAHELRSPLTGVKGFTSTLLRKWDRFSDEQRQFMLETVDADADRLSRLITDLLDAARLDSGRMTLRISEFDLGELVERILVNISAGTGRRLTVETDADEARIWADEDRIAQLVTNLVQNALTHGQGIRDIVVRTPVDARGGVVLSVSDQGPGIPAGSKTRIFNRFWKGGQGAGSGLGLYIVKGIVDKHGGAICFADHPHGGTTASVWLPRNVPEGLAD